MMTNNKSSSNDSGTASVRRVDLRWYTFEWQTSFLYFAIVIDNVFSKEECDALISRSNNNRGGYEEALVNVGGGRQQKMSHVRNCERCIIDDPGLAEDTWQRVVRILNSLEPEQQRQRMYESDALQLERLYEIPGGWTAVGLNERSRFLRYNPGMFFKSHYDGQYVRQSDASGSARNGETSFVTCQMYLNDNFEGGETRFLVPPEKRSLPFLSTDVIPKIGSVLLFQHDLLHEGRPVTAGCKYMMRTDVMYTRQGPGHEYSCEPIVEPMEE